MDKVPIPVDLLAVGRPVPVDVWSEGGQLLLRKGQRIESEQHKERLRAHGAAAHAGDAYAWQRAHARQVWELLREGADIAEIARLPMPGEILERDYLEERQLHGGWLDLQEALRVLHYHGGLAIHPRERLAGLQARALALLEEDADDSLFCLFQALAREDLGYCATHALLCAVMSELTARRLGLDAMQRASLMGAALTMNIGMALEQDGMVRQPGPLVDWQRLLVVDHPRKSEEVLQGMGIDDADLLDIVRWHREPNTRHGLPRNLLARRILCVAEVFVAKMAARKTRPPLSPLHAAKSVYLGAKGEMAAVGSAMAAAIGFYPPGSHVALVNGEVAVVVRRGARANTPWVLPIIDRKGMPTTELLARDTSEAAHAIKAPVSFRQVRMQISPERARRERARIARLSAAGPAP